MPAKIKIPLIHTTVILIALLAFGVLETDDALDPNLKPALPAEYVQEIEKGDITSAIEAADSFAETQLRNAVNDEEKLTLAMQQFTGFMFQILYVERAICQREGIDISPLADAMAEENSQEILVLQNKNFDVEAASKLLKSSPEAISAMTKVSELNMSRLIAENGFASVKAICEHYATHASSVAKLLRFKDVNPEAHAALGL